MEQSVALVAVENVAYHFDIFYSYTVPEFLKDKVQTGMRVMVPFGRSKTARRQGVVFGFAPVEQGIKYKDIISILDDEPFLPKKTLKLQSFSKTELSVLILRVSRCSFRQDMAIRLMLSISQLRLRNK